MGLSRFIPACAGNAWTGLLHGQDVPVHPRMRGERSSRSGPGVASHGSSLHARGTPLDGQPRFALTRFIPACAGNAVVSMLPYAIPPVHPRMRGERYGLPVPLSNRRGSSPHARGTPRESYDGCLYLRFIPACAGNASLLIGGCTVETVHPRMRGERSSCFGAAFLAGGSSPHARGTLLYRRCQCLTRRFIPACAGNAARSSGHPSPGSVHPRMRGERYAEDQEWEPGDRFIPACAGNAADSSRTRAIGSVHPRMRGERDAH